MKQITLLSLLLCLLCSITTSAQKGTSGEKYGNTLNAGIGLGYYGYVGYSIPVIHANFEFDVARNFTLAPFISFYSYNRYQYWGNNNYPYRNYSYHQTVIPVGLKGSYYFDQFLHAGSKWDFYLAASVGIAIRKTRWESGYYGTTEIHNGTTGVYLDGHIGAEYHLTNKLGLVLDLSTGMSTFCLAIHL